jgi:hypothetical protein
VPRQLAKELAAFEVKTVRDMGWTGVKNGALIDLAQGSFEAIFTVDRDFGGTYQAPLPIGVVVLEVGSTYPLLLRPHMPAVAIALQSVRAGQVIRVGT